MESFRGQEAVNGSSVRALLGKNPRILLLYTSSLKGILSLAGFMLRCYIHSLNTELLSSCYGSGTALKEVIIQ